MRRKCSKDCHWGWVGNSPRVSEDVGKTLRSWTSMGDMTLVLLSHWPGSSPL